MRAYRVDQVFGFVLRHLVTSKESSNPIFFWKRPIFLLCAAYSKLPSFIGTIGEIEKKKTKKHRENKIGSVNLLTGEHIFLSIIYAVEKCLSFKPSL